MIFEPLDFLARLAGLVPSPGVNLASYHGLFAPNYRLRGLFVSARGGCPIAGRAVHCRGRVAMSRARRLTRVFGIQIKRCERCAGAPKIIASIDDLDIIAHILEHLERRDLAHQLRPVARALPLQGD